MLIECLLSMSIGLLLMSCLISTYLGLYQSAKMQFSLNKIRDRAETIKHLLKEDIHQAGNSGCALLSKDFPLMSLNAYPFTVNNQLTGTNTAFTVQYAKYPHAVLKLATNDSRLLFATTNINIKKGDILMISNCKYAEIFNVKNISRLEEMQIITPETPLHYQFNAFAEITHLVKNKYFIAKTTRKKSDGQEGDSLFLEDIHHIKHEVIRDVSEMHISYDFFKDGKIISIPTNQINDWSEMIGMEVRIQLHEAPIKKTLNMYFNLRK